MINHYTPSIIRDWNQEKDYISVKLNEIIDWVN